ncbi:MAG: tRNA (adenosine(37)-N6)-threonylcarbamoyltransferase complex ATPase subunit type 1 TsaE [Pseudomonadota bacterium]
MAYATTFGPLDLHGIERLAELFACKLQPGQTVTLTGDLGQGKSTFARAAIRGFLADAAADVPSPTFSIVQVYDGNRGAIWHCDWYRLGAADELAELGVEAAFETAIVLVEWPAVGAGALPDDRIDLELRDVPGEPDARAVAAMATGRRSARTLERIVMLDRALASAQLGHVLGVRYLQGDASSRSYARADTANGSVILMDAPAMPDGPPVRDGKPYSRIAHLAEDVRPFVAIARHLKQHGLSVPHILHADLGAGVLVIEDLGDAVFTLADAGSAQQSQQIRAAVDVLLHVRRVRPPIEMTMGDEARRYALPLFDTAAREIEADLLLDWAWPSLNRAACTPAAREAFHAAWAASFEGLADETGWVLRDYHSPNLLGLPDREGVAGVGVIDFQDAMAGHWAYDLVSLLQDARMDVEARIESAELM